MKHAMSDRIRVRDMLQRTERVMTKVLGFAHEHPESQIFYEVWHNLDNARARLDAYYRQQFGNQPQEDT